MRQASKRIPESAEKTVRDIRRATRRHHSAEEKIRIVLEGLRGEDSIAELCRKEGINQNLSFPKIISARSDDAVHPRRAQQRRYRTVGLLDAVAHPCAVIGACAIHYSRWRTCSEFASGAPRQRSASDPGTRGAQCRSGVPHTRFAMAIEARLGGHEYPWLS